LGFLAHQLTQQGAAGLSSAFSRRQPGCWPLLLVALLLMPVNWGLEQAKWLSLMRAIGVRPDRREALRALLAGISFSIATPNRIGEYAGRVLLLAPEHRWAGALSSILGSACQWGAFLALGWPALWAWGGRLGWASAWGAGALAALGPLMVLLAILSWAYLRQRSLPTWVHRIPLPKSLIRLPAELAAFRAIGSAQLARAVMLACNRFAVFCVQYWLLLYAFGLPLPPGWGVAGIAAIYLIQAGLPLPPGAGLLARVDMAFWLWGHLPGAKAAILSASLGLFVINLGMPSLLGLWHIVKKQ
jgi:hypothetical protein